jgi:tetratricopeptide (TPR) repeat protein
MFYAPLRGMAEVRDRAPLGAATLLAWLAQSLYTAYVLWPVMSGAWLRSSGAGLFTVLVGSFFSVLFTGVVFVPVTILVANAFERRASFGLAVQQDYAATASAVFYAWAAACLAAFPFHLLARATGVEQTVVARTAELTRTLAEQQNFPPESVALMLDAGRLLESFAQTVLLPFLALWIFLALREVFRLSWLRTALLLLASLVIMLPLAMILGTLYGWVFASPFLLIMVFFLMRGYVGEVMRQQRARTSFKQNLEASTLNPADASAHYNLGLLHLNRKELDEARARFERAVSIDPEEVDSHFQLGRIARTESRLPDAIKHFEQVVARDQTHAQHEIWREIGATYIHAGQFSDAHDALERFLAHRQLDPEGLYLMGRALAGMGRPREAAESMQACIEAVRTAPAYKYRSEKRWLNEAQQFLRSQT